MRAFRFSRRMQYDTVYEAGQVIDHLPEADTENLRLGGFGDYVETEETTDAPNVPAVADGDEPTNPGGEGSDDPSAPPADPGPETLTCPAGCNGGKPFASAEALAKHRSKKRH